MAKLRGQVYEVITSPMGSAARKEALEEYADVRRAFDDGVAGTRPDVPEGDLLAAARTVGAGGRAVLSTADVAVSAPSSNPADAASGLERLDGQTDALDEEFGTLIGRLDALQIDALTDTRAARQTAARTVMAASVLGVLLLLALTMLTAASILRGLGSVAEAARRLAAGDLDARFTASRRDEIGALGGAFNATTDSLQAVVNRLEEQRRRDTFGRHVNEALEMADTEDETYEAVRRSFLVVTAHHPMELLVADSSRAHLELRADHPDAGAPGCPVESPFGCVAVRRGTTTTFADSTALNACPKLRDRGGEALSAVCVPVAFMGRALGVLHTTAPAAAPPGPEEVARLATVASSAGARIGTVRSFERAQLQASTDGLTGLMNRRTFEGQARRLVRRGEQLAIVMADVDHFKLVNDTHGHEAGDRALTLFAQQLRTHLRSEDLLARYGGEKFVILRPGSSAEQAVNVLDRFRVRLAHATSTQPPAFTASFGVAGSERSTSLADLIRRADTALYRAKATGRDRVIIDQSAASEEYPRGTTSALERAIRDDDPLADMIPMR